MTRIIRVCQGIDLRSFGKNLLDQFQSIVEKVGGQSRHPRDVAAWIHETLDESRLHQIAGAGDNYRNGARGFLGGDGNPGAANHDYIDFVFDQLARELWQALDLSFSVFVFDDEVLSLDIATAAQSLAQSFITGLIHRW